MPSKLELHSLYNKMKRQDKDWEKISTMHILNVHNIYLKWVAGSFHKREYVDGQ